MRIIFLDVDGVLNNYNTKDRCGVYTGIDSKHVDILNRIYLESNKVDTTVIVLSSSWRTNVNNNNNFLEEGHKYLTDKLEEFNLSIYDETPVIKRYMKNGEIISRGKEIATWLANNKDKDIKGVLVLDDDMFEDFRLFGITKHLVKTSWYSKKGGLQEKHIKQALEVLNKPVKIKGPEEI